MRRCLKADPTWRTTRTSNIFRSAAKYHEIQAHRDTGENRSLRGVAQTLNDAWGVQKKSRAALYFNRLCFNSFFSTT